MAHDGQEIEGPAGTSMRFVSTGPDTLEMEASYSGEAGMPPEHVHPSQRERFEVLEGAMQTIVGGDERRYEAGESYEVAPGTPHQMAAADGPTRVRWEVTPPLRTAEFFERLYGSGPDSAREAESIMDFLAEFDAEIRFTGA